MIHAPRSLSQTALSMGILLLIGFTPDFFVGHLKNGLISFFKTIR